MSKLKICLEKQLEVDKLWDSEKQANKTGEFDILYHSIKKDQEQQSEEPVDTSSVVDEPATDTNIEDQSPVYDTEAPKEDLEVAKEAIRNYALEAWYDRDSLTNSEISLTVKALGSIGLNFGPKIFKLFKGVLLTMGKILQLSISTTELISNYIYRKKHNYTKLKEDISDIRRILSNLGSDEVDISDVKFGKTKIINSLKISDSVDLSNNIAVLSQFISDIIGHLSQQTNKDLETIKHIIAYSTSGATEVPSRLMVEYTLKDFLYKKTLKNYPVSSENTNSYVYKDTLPGDVNLISFLPSPEIKDLSVITEAYNQSKMFFGFNVESFKSIETLDYMTVADLNNFLDKVEELCDLCMKQQALYENINQKKKRLLYSFKLYFSNIITSKTKVSLKDSFLEYVYLKTAFIDKVYIMAAMDIHDYSIRVITNSLIYAKENVTNVTK